MNTNLNQLLKDLETGPAYVKILICLLGCTFMLYPTFSLHLFFRELPVYEQVLFTSGSSALNRFVGNVSAAVHCGWHFHTQGKERRERQCTLLTPL